MDFEGSKSVKLRKRVRLMRISTLSFVMQRSSIKITAKTNADAGENSANTSYKIFGGNNVGASVPVSEVDVPSVVSNVGHRRRRPEKIIKMKTYPICTSLSPAKVIVSP